MTVTFAVPAADPATAAALVVVDTRGVAARTQGHLPVDELTAPTATITCDC